MMAWALLLLLSARIEGATDDFSKELQRSAISATVRITNAAEKSVGSGTVIRQQGSFVYVLTAGHVVKKADRLEVQTFSAASYPKPAATYESAKVMAEGKDGNHDLAVIRFVTGDPMPGSARICPPRLLPQGKTFAALSVGCGDGQKPACLKETVTGKRWVRKPGEKGEALYWEVSRRTVKGRSGGPLLDKRGRLIGVCSGSNDGRGYYCHVDEIRRFLTRNGLKWLYEEE